MQGARGTATCLYRCRGIGLIPGPRIFLLVAACLYACGALAAESESRVTAYGLIYRVTPSPSAHSVLVTVTVSQGDDLLREMRFDADPERYSDFEADGALSVANGRVLWTPPADGGSLRWQVAVPNRRNGSGYDAWLDESWGLFRAEDIIPRAATRTLVGISSETSLEFSLPGGWSAVTEYAKRNERFAVAKAGRRFSQPSGWIVLGKLGVRRERIAGTRVAVAAPENQGVRRMDMLALLNWTLPELERILPAMPSRLTVVSAGSPMWRGALSAPQSIYVHAERPLISENGTSTLLHEVVHVALGANPGGDFDWIVEGLAEYYSLQLLRRSGSITPARFEHAMQRQFEWAGSADALCGPSSTGATTALAVTIFATLDREIRGDSDGSRSLDDVVHKMLQASAPLNLASLSTAATDVLGEKPDALHIDKLVGCRTMAADRDSST